ncbi:OLC1v1002472C1 [Oldenlandia corymbosa var. corymbosa]|uniref:OLC1v1002472C1 n=1 Tax=Oldenlandia corymbosa var. corymbosa TaxID=529605 RepID=A0AAV1D7Q8_OLDCO|nr:OLC1v1002472C1 [Oldenlandia corymbosa var. corymbosa]
MVASSAATTKFSFHVGPTALQVISTAASLQLGSLLRRHILSGFFLPSSSSYSKISHLGHLYRLRDVWHQKAIPCTGSSVLKWSCNAISGTFMSMSIFGGDSGEGDSEDLSRIEELASRFFSNDGTWTQTLLRANLAVYAGQIATRGKLTDWGAKINSLISKGQIWRLVTPAFLHANILHLMDFSGSRRFLTIYVTSAITGSVMSYWLFKNPSVGASGAIFGLIGAYSVFLLRNKEMIADASKIVRLEKHVFVFISAFGSFAKGIDNWAHIGGFLGGVASSWLLGPAYKLRRVSFLGKKEFIDEPPISAIAERYKKRDY